jgi:hypothetical protein
MSDDGAATTKSPTANRALTWACIAFAAAVGVHGLDHLRRGMVASPPSIMIGGMIQGVFVVAAVVLVVRRHRLAPEAAIVVGAFRIRARVADFSTQLSGQLHFRAADQRHVVLLAHGRRRNRQRADSRLCRCTGTAPRPGCLNQLPCGASSHQTRIQSTSMSAG